MATLTGKTIGQLAFLPTPPLDTLIPIESSGVTFHTVLSGISTSLIEDIVYSELYNSVVNGLLKPGQWYRLTDYRSVNFINGWEIANNNPSPTDPNFIPRQIYTGDTEVLLLQAKSNYEIAEVGYSETFNGDIVQYEPFTNKIGVNFTIQNTTTLPNSIIVSGFDLQWDGTNVYFDMPIDYPALLGHYFIINYTFSGNASSQSGEFEPLTPNISICQYPSTPTISRIKVENNGQKIVLLDLTENDYNNYDLNSLYVETIYEIGNAYGWITRRIDTFRNIDVPFDFRGRKYRRFECEIFGNITDIITSATGTTATDGTYIIGSYSSTSVAGNSATFKVIVQSNSVSNVVILNYGKLYVVGDILTIDGTQIGGVSGDDDIVITINKIVSNIKYWGQGDNFFGALSTGNYTDYSCFSVNAGAQVYNVRWSDMGGPDMYNYRGFNDNFVSLGSFYSNVINSRSYNITIGDLFVDNEINSNFIFNTIVGGFYQNKIGYFFYENIIGDSFYRNSILGLFSQNNIQQSFYYNTVDFDFNLNTIGNNFTYNTIYNNFNSNFIKGGFSFNTINADFGSNTFGSSTNYNTIKDRFQSNTVSDSFMGNIINYDFQSNMIGNDFKSNVVGNYFYNNNINDRFAYNQIGNNFYSNFIGTDFGSGGGGDYGNIIGDEFTNNTIGNFFYSNHINTYFNNNTIGDYFETNEIQNFFQTNTIDDNFEKNKIGNNFIRNTIGLNFISNTIGDNFGNNGGGSPGFPNTILDNFQFNQIGNNFGNDGTNIDGGNLINSGFKNNVIGDDFYFNLIDADFTNNKIGNQSIFNSIGIDFVDNQINNVFVGNTIVDELQSNKIGNYFGFNTIGNNFKRNVIGDFFGNAGSGTENNILDDFTDNQIGNYFGNDGTNLAGGNTISNSFTKNQILSTKVYGYDFTPATYVYDSNMTKIIFDRQDGTPRLSYYDSSDVLNITNIDN